MKNTTAVYADRWFRHSATTSREEKFSELIDSHGLYGYGLWWLLSEVVGHSRQLDLSHSQGEWARQLGTSVAKMKIVLNTLDRLGLIRLHVSGTALTIRIPSLLVHDRPAANVWAIIRASIFQRDNFTCQYCGKYGGRLECDHIVPVAKGGKSDDSNLATACFPCNRSKRDKTPSEWRGL